MPPTYKSSESLEQNLPEDTTQVTSLAEKVVIDDRLEHAVTSQDIVQSVSTENQTIAVEEVNTPPAPEEEKKNAVQEPEVEVYHTILGGKETFKEMKKSGKLVAFEPVLQRAPPPPVTYAQEEVLSHIEANVSLDKEISFFGAFFPYLMTVTIFLLSSISLAPFVLGYLVANQYLGVTPEGLYQYKSILFSNIFAGKMFASVIEVLLGSFFILFCAQFADSVTKKTTSLFVKFLLFVFFVCVSIGIVYGLKVYKGIDGIVLLHAFLIKL